VRFAPKRPHAALLLAPDQLGLAAGLSDDRPLILDDLEDSPLGELSLACLTQALGCGPDLGQRDSGEPSVTEGNGPVAPIRIAQVDLRHVARVISHDELLPRLAQKGRQYANRVPDVEERQLLAPDGPVPERQKVPIEAVEVLRQAGRCRTAGDCLRPGRDRRRAETAMSVWW
jgi:hypothetical protein